MICKDSVLTWFKGISSDNRIDLMCSLLNKCLPFELRFIGTCLEDLGRQDFSQMKDFEVKANNAAELSEFKVQCIISDTRTRRKLAVYVCLLHSLNSACSTLIYKSLYGLDLNEVVSTAKCTDNKILEELLTIYTIAVNHPAFSFEQRSNLGSILLRLKQEESRLTREKYAEIVNAEYTKSQQLQPSDNLGGLPPNIPPGLAYPPGLGSPGNYVQFPCYPQFPPSPMAHPHPIVLHVVNYPPLPDGLPNTDIPPPYTASPLLSRTTSPSQSAQHSRAGSPSTRAFISRNESLPKIRPPYAEPPTASAHPYPFRSDKNDGPPEIDNVVQSISERLGDLSTDEMLRGAVASLNGISGSGARIPPLRHSQAAPPLDPEALSHGAGAVPFTTAIDTSVPPPILVPNAVIHPTLRLNQQPIVEQNSHGNDDGRNCTSSSGSNASSTSHSPPITPANAQHNWAKGYDHEEKNVQPKPRSVMNRGRAQGVHNLARERGPFAGNARREAAPHSAPPTPHEEKKSYLIPPSCVEVSSSPVVKPIAAPDMVATGLSYTSPFLPGPFTGGTPYFQSYAPTFVRPFSYPNGDVLYTYQPQPAPYLPSPLVTYTSIPPPKIACYNCSSQSHHPNDCKEPTMEEYSSKGQYRIDYGKMNEMFNMDK